MKKIIITANSSWYIYNFRLSTIRYLQERNYKIIVLAPQDEYSSKLKKYGCTFSNLYVHTGGVSPLRDSFTVMSYLYFFLIYSPFCVLTFTPKATIYTSLITRLIKTPTIVNISGLGRSFNSDNFLTKIVTTLYKISLKDVVACFFQNNEDKSFFLENELISINQAYKISGSGVDLKKFRFSPVDFEKPLRFLFCGRLLKSKGVLVLKAAAEILKREFGEDLQFDVLGIYSSGDDAISKEEVASWDKDVNLRYLGVSDSVKDIVKDYHFVVLPTLYREGVPRSLIEASALGKVLIATNNVGCTDVVKESINGYLCEKNSIDSLVDAIKKTLDLSPNSYLEMAKESRLLAESKFDEQEILKMYYSVIESIV
ncbi:glycosyltransferase family 4 protein [Halobacteriovorax sp. DA5]|uniref:glycosyltransferase family 4 protein n=1 Tax=Halobacteriovorax sp. DA5 TaxID=2067553 RepID=UPI001E52FD16|nr:glycosyltransferase family 4 protein [Halobacteriovorax sp. DA5]